MGAALFAQLAMACASGGQPQSARERLLLAGEADPVGRSLATPHRMAVIYWPAIGECTPAERRIARRLGELGERFGDIEIVTVIPEGARADGGRYGVAFPGEVVSVGPKNYARQRALGPLPRVEVWSGAGELLLLRSVPALASQADLLAEEIEWSRAFTRPVGERD